MNGTQMNLGGTEKVLDLGSDTTLYIVIDVGRNYA